MSANRDREEEIFDAARELAADERAAYLAERCGQDADLRKRIEGMLEADAAAGEFFKTHDVPAPTAVLADASLSPSIEKAGVRGIHIMDVNGNGDMGLTTNISDEVDAAWSPAGQLIAYAFLSPALLQRSELPHRFGGFEAL